MNASQENKDTRNQRRVMNANQENIDTHNQRGVVKQESTPLEDLINHLWTPIKKTETLAIKEVLFKNKKN